MNSNVLLLVVLVLSFYGAGLIWSVQLIVFRSWQLLGNADELHKVQADYWRKLPWFVFAPVGILFILTIVLLRQPPPFTPEALVWASFWLQLLSHSMTVLMWARWERRIIVERHPPDSLLLARLVATHWIRTALITLNALALFCAGMVTFR
jgi:hypothetical protein